MPGVLMFWPTWWRKRDRFILAALAEREPRYGLELALASGGLLGRGTVYVFLARLEAFGLVKSKAVYDSGGWWWDDGLPARRMYFLTDAGRVLAEAS